MLRKMQRLLADELAGNTYNYISFYSGSNRIRKTYQDLDNDITILLEKFFYLNSRTKISRIGILGYTSYEWMVADLACIKGGFLSVAIPENCSRIQLEYILKETRIDLLLVDRKLTPLLQDISVESYVYGSGETCANNSIDKVPRIKKINGSILENYGICFSSGTSENFKFINLKFPTVVKKKGIKENINTAVGAFFFKLSFWSKRDNKVIIFMPFSHYQQRSFIYQALLLKVNITISDPINCIRHIIIEKPNIMISVPTIYELLAQRISTKLTRFTGLRKKCFYLFNFLGINKLPNGNYFKKVISHFLLRDITKIYGGKADYFVTGSAAINPDHIKLFLSIGVKLYEAYGQTEIGIISMNSTRHFKLGSVGKPSRKIFINEDDEILVDYDESKYGHNKSVFSLITVGDTKYIQTGDLGYLDNAGYLFLKGRKDEVLVLTNGKKIFPTEIEKKIVGNENINYALLFSPDNFTINIILSTTGNTRIESIYALIGLVNSKLPDYAKIKNFLIAPEEFTIENGFLTATFKMKRKFILSNHNSFKFQKIESVNSVN